MRNISAVESRSQSHSKNGSEQKERNYLMRQYILLLKSGQNGEVIIKSTELYRKDN